MKIKQASEIVILGIDPGTSIMGYGLIKVKNTQIELLQYGVIHLEKLVNYQLKLQRIFQKILHLIDEYHPDEMALEAPFFGKNVQSMLKLGRAQGVAMAAGLYREIAITEYSPKKIKLSITGNGNASKEQVAGVLMNQFKIKDLPKNLDATDGLATALCHFYNRNKPVISEDYSGWEAFIKKNPNRIK